MCTAGQLSCQLQLLSLRSQLDGLSFSFLVIIWLHSILLHSFTILYNPNRIFLFGQLSYRYSDSDTLFANVILITFLRRTYCRMVGHVNLLRTPKMVLLIDTLKEEAQLHRKLNIFAQVVEKLLSLEPMPREKVAKKLNQLEVVILEVDALAFPELVKEWKKKLESYWRILIPTTDKSEQSRFEAFLASLNSKRNHHSHLSR